jgi:hypothetical protein
VEETVGFFERGPYDVCPCFPIRRKGWPPRRGAMAIMRRLRGVYEQRAGGRVEGEKERKLHGKNRLCQGLHGLGGASEIAAYGSRRRLYFREMVYKLEHAVWSAINLGFERVAFWWRMACAFCMGPLKR